MESKKIKIPMKSKLLNFFWWLVLILISGSLGAGLVYVALSKRY